MSLEQSSSSMLGINSILDISESSKSDSLIGKDKSNFYSSGSSFELSNIQSSAEAGNSINEIIYPTHSKTD